MSCCTSCSAVYSTSSTLIFTVATQLCREVQRQKVVHAVEMFQSAEGRRGIHTLALCDVRVPIEIKTIFSGDPTLQTTHSRLGCFYFFIPQSSVMSCHVITDAWTCFAWFCQAEFVPCGSWPWQAIQSGMQRFEALHPKLPNLPPQARRAPCIGTEFCDVR